MGGGVSAVSVGGGGGVVSSVGGVGVGVGGTIVVGTGDTGVGVKVGGSDV